MYTHRHGNPGGNARPRAPKHEQPVPAIGEVEQLAQGHLLDLIRLGRGHQGLSRLRLSKQGEED